MKRINVYERKKGHKGFSAKLPYIVASRMNDELINNLQKDNYPILLEGLHCTGILSQLDLSKRKVVVRMHNEERFIIKNWQDPKLRFLKNYIFLHESKLIKKYNHHLPGMYLCLHLRRRHTHFKR